MRYGLVETLFMLTSPRVLLLIVIVILIVILISVMRKK